jgi:WD40 repeat protein
MLDSMETPGARREHDERAPSVPDHQLLTKIGEGSYGEVWLARNVIGTGRAVKVVYRRAFDSARPFEREFNGIRKFEPVSRSHEGLVDILQVGRNDEAGYFYYVMELADNASAQSSCPTPDAEATLEQPTIQGDMPYVPRTLAGELARRGRLPIEECLPLFLSLAGALVHLHKHGLIHRDIKPANIIFVLGMAKLADIGLVSEAGRSDSYVGTEGYIPPEGPGTRLADIYSLGKLFYEVSTGQDRAEFPALPIELEQLDRHEGLLELNAIFVKACAGEPRYRYQSVEEMQAELALLQSGKSVRRLRTIERRLARATRTGLVAGGLFAVAMTAYVFTHFQAHVAQKNYERAEGQRLRAERAERNALEQLCSAYLAQARASRLNGRTGHRLESLRSISKAVAIASPGDHQLLLQLRNEAIASLALIDVQPVSATTQLVTLSQWPPFDARLERFLEAGGDGELRICQATNHQRLFGLPGAVTGPILGTEFSPDGQYVQVVSQARQCKVWDLRRREVVLATPAEPAAWLWEFSPDSCSLALAFTNGALVVRELASGKTNRVLNLQPDSRDLKFRPDGRAFAIWRYKARLLEIRDSETGVLIRAWPYEGPERHLAWSPTGARLAAVGGDLTCQVWDAARDRPLQPLRGHASIVVDVGFLGSDDLLTSCSWDGTLRVWAVPNARQLLEVRGSGVRFSLDPVTGRLALLLDRGYGWELKFFDVLRGGIAREYWERTDLEANGPWDVAFSPDERWLASASEDGVHLWNLGNGREAAHLPGPLAQSVAFSEDGTSLLASSKEGVFRTPLRWGRQDTPLEDDTKITLSRPEPLFPTPPTRPYGRACLTSKGDLFATTGGGPIQVLRSGTNVAELSGSDGAFYLATSPDGDWVAAGFRWKFKVELWGARDGRHVREFHLGSPANVAFSPDSRWLVIGTTDEFRFWEIATGTPGLRIMREQSTGLVGHMAFRQDGKLLALDLGQWLVALLDPATGRELARLEHPNSQIISGLAFSPSGTQLAVATQGHVVQIWDLARTHKELAALKLDW